MKTRNERYITAQSDYIDCEIEHPEFGWVPCTITEAEYPKEWAAAIAKEGPAAVQPYVPPTTAELLQIERATKMNPYRLAFRAALKQINTPTPGVNLLQATEAMVTAVRAVDAQNDVVGWYDDVQQIIRTHPDISKVQEFVQTNGGLTLTDEMLDAICRLGVAIDQMKDPVELTALAAAANAEWSV